MYRAFFNLQCKPFEVAPDAAFLWLGEKHREALAGLRYGILENKGFLLFTGEAGIGKTTLVNALLASLHDSVVAAVITDPARERLEFYNAIAAGFGLAREFTSKVEFLLQFSHFLHKSGDEGKKVLLLIDDCQRLSQEMLEELRLLSNIEKADAKLINIFFVGQREFNDTLVQPQNRALRQRLTVKVDLAPFTAEESEAYIDHRLKVAGSTEKIFSTAAVRRIHQYAMGVPRRLNIICDHALVAACVQGRRNIDEKIVEECAQKLNLPLKPTSQDFAGLEQEKSHLQHFRGRFTPGAGASPGVVTGFNLEKQRRFPLWQVGAAGLVAAGFALAFWQYGPGPDGGAVVDPVKTIERTEEKKAGSQESPPLAGQMEQSPAGTGDGRGGERKGFIPARPADDDDSISVAAAGSPAGQSAATIVSAAPLLPVGGGGAAATAVSGSPLLPAVDGQSAVTIVSASPLLPIGGGESATTAVSAAPLLPAGGGQLASPAVSLPSNDKPPGPARPAAAPAEGSSAGDATPLPPVASASPVLSTAGGQDAAVKTVTATPPLPSTTTDSRGQGVAAVALPAKVVLPLSANSRQLTDEGRALLRDFVDNLKAAPQRRVLVKGYVSSSTASAENTRLSEERAERVRKLLVASGIEARRIEIKGMGIEEPIASNATAEGRTKNRRVEIVVLENGR